MFNELTNKKDCVALQTVLNIASGYLPLDFLLCIFQHMRKQKGNNYDHHFLANAFTLTEQLSGGQPLTARELELTYAIVALMESGHVYSEEYPYDVSNGLAYQFLKDHAGEVFNAGDRRLIARYCRPVYPHSLKPNDHTSIILLSHNVRRLVDVVFPDTEQFVKHFVKQNISVGAEKRFKPVEASEWIDSLVEKFKALYGFQGSLWGTLSHGPKETYSKEVYTFQANAENQALIRTLIAKQ